jgi:hypothetical protein
MPIQKKMSIEAYIKREFTVGSEPSRKTIVTWIKKGIIQGVELGGKYWVYEQISAADELVNSVLRKAS